MPSERSFQSDFVDASCISPTDVSLSQSSKSSKITPSASGDSDSSWRYQRKTSPKDASMIRPSFSFWRNKATKANKLGTFDGVFLPCISQILGVIFFLRLPTITAQAGTFGATLIILVCVLSTLVTSLSLSAIATNGTIQAGGPYYIISRTLGVEVGGSLGLLFYLGTTLGSSMYVLGAVEAFQTNLDDYGAAAAQAAADAVDDLVAYYEIDDDDDDLLEDEEEFDEPEFWFGASQIASLALMFALTLVVTIGMKYVSKAANVFLLTVMASILCIVIGTVLFAAEVWDGSLHSEIDRVFMDNLWPRYSRDPQTNIRPTFFSLVALFYPSVTGIMAGTNRSATLATPEKSIPVGTIGAIAVTSILYLFQVWLLGCVVAHETLLENKLVVACIAFPSRAIVKIGIIIASIGAALQCLTGAPQLLAAIAVDDGIPFLRFIRPKVSEKDGTSQQNEPFLAIWVTWAIASVATLAGNLDLITPIITMFFLLMYGGINLCCFLLGWVHAPGFRPTFKYFHRNISLFGFLWCIGMAMVISWVTALCAVGLFGLNYYYIYRKQTDPESGEVIGAHWGDVGDSLRYKLTTIVLMKVTGTENFHAKHWRPQLLTIVDTDDTGNPLSMELLALAAQLEKGRGLNIMISIKKGSLLKPGAFEASQEVRAVMKQHMKNEGCKGFAAVAVTHAGFCEAVLSAVTHSGLGPVSPNIVLFSWMKDWKEHPERARALSDTILGLINMKRAIALFKGGNAYPRRGDIVSKGIIDIYWVVEDGGLCLLLPYLISRQKIWRKDVRIRVFAVASKVSEDPDLLEKSVVDHLRRVRIPASVTVIDMSSTSIAADMREFHIKHRDTSDWQRMTIGEAFSQEMESCSRTGNDLEDLGPRPVMQGNVGQEVGEGAQLQTAKLFNQAIRFYSNSTNLVVTCMPRIQSMNGSSAFFAYIDAMSTQVENMLLVRGSEFEVVTGIA